MKSYFTLSGCVLPQSPCLPEIGFLIAFCFSGYVHAYPAARSREAVIKTKSEISNEETVAYYTWADKNIGCRYVRCLSHKLHTISMWKAHQDEWQVLGHNPNHLSRGRARLTINSLLQQEKFPFVPFVLSISLRCIFLFLFVLNPVPLPSPSPPHTNSLWSQTLGAAEGRGSIIPISWENSRSVITLSQAIKLLPRSDRWQMLEGLFIFCLLIRAARRGGGTERERGVRERYKRKRKKEKKGKGEHLVPVEATTFT